MNIYRAQLPQLGDSLFLTDGGLETTMIYQLAVELPEFSAITLMDGAEKRQIARDYFQAYLQLAQRYGTGFILESVTWRSSSDWAGALGYSRDFLEALNRIAIRMLHELREEYESPQTPVVISGCLGPRGDGYDASTAPSANEAQYYHAGQIKLFREEQVDMVSAFTLTCSDEAIGITRAAQAENIPVVISFTVETDGRLPSGQSLAAAITDVDIATGQGPAYYMINCSHPTHFLDTLRANTVCLERIRGIRANASCKSHAELNESCELDSGDPDDLGRHYQELLAVLPNLTVLGGCCGTDHRHIEAIARVCINQNRMNLTT